MVSNLLWSIGLVLFAFGEQEGACCLPNGDCIEVVASVCNVVHGAPRLGACIDTDGLGVSDVCERASGDIYWMRFDLTSHHQLLRSDRNGFVYQDNPVAEVERTQRDFVNFFADIMGGRIYWLSNNNIIRARMDGSEADYITPLANGAPIGLIFQMVPDVPRRSIIAYGQSGRMWRINLETLIATELVGFGWANLEQLLYVANSRPSDSDTDGDVDLRDFAAFQNAMTGP